MNFPSSPIGRQLLRRGVWRTLPIGTFFRISLSLSYAIPTTVLIVLVVLLVTARGRENWDLVPAAMIATTVWVAGIATQAVIYGVALRKSSENLTLEIGLIGPRWVPGRIDAKRTLQVASLTLTALVLQGTLLRFAADTTSVPAMADSTSLTPLVIRGFGLTRVDSMLHFSGTLLWVQALCQCYPLGMSLGRHLLAAVFTWLPIGNDCSIQGRRLHKLLLVFSLGMSLMAIWLLPSESATNFARWPLFLLLAYMLARSTSVPRCTALIESFHRSSNIKPAPDQASGRDSEDTHSISETIERTRASGKVRDWMSRRRLRRAMRQERSEATDVAKLDQILDRLSQHGVEGLSREDRLVLNRVSQTLRKHKSAMTSMPGQSDPANQANSGDGGKA